MLRELRQVPCVDCGGRFEPFQMDFDHRNPSAKSFDLTKGRAMLMATAKLLAEAAKCDVICVNCHRVRTRDARLKWPPRHSKTTPSAARKMNLWCEHSRLLNALRDVPCMDCSGRFPPCAMDFDHRDPTMKRYTVTRMRARVSTQVILDEVAKCDIVCGNCHRLRTESRRAAQVIERE